MVDNIQKEVPIVTITDFLVSEAIKRANEVRKNKTKLNEYTYRNKGEGIELGCLAEIIFETQLELFSIPKTDWENNNTKALDYTVRDLKIEVKSKDRTVPPQPEYACTVSNYNADFQKVDFYYFVSFQRDKKSAGINGIKWPHSAHLVGASSSQFFHNHSIFLREGDRDGPNMTIKFDCHNIRIEHTIPNDGFMVKCLGGSTESGKYAGNTNEGDQTSSP